MLDTPLGHPMKEEPQLRFDADDVEDLDTADALEAVRNALEENPKGPSRVPDVLDLKDLRVLESIFQPRDLTFRAGDHEAHVDTLAKAIGKPEKPKYLDPITVWWGGDRWYVLDGHHRRLAYERAKIKKGIPVRAFEGTLEEALAQSVSLNSKNKLAMSPQDKMNTAWRLTTCTDFLEEQDRGGMRRRGALRCEHAQRHAGLGRSGEICRGDGCVYMG